MSSSTVPIIFKNTGVVVGEIPFESIHANPNTPVTQENITTITSYNLLEKKKRTIIVPGSPSIWAPKKLPATIKPDSGKCFTDPVRHIFPKCPLEPLFRALSTTKPDFNLQETNFITDRRNLRLLLSFVRGSKAEFRIEVEVAGTTVLFSCWQKKATSYIHGFQGYGREFEKGFTRVPKCVAGSVTHNRAVSYTLGGLKMVVRFEVDAYIDGGKLPGKEKATRGGIYVGPSHAVMKQSNVPQTPTGYTVAIRGQFTPPHQIVEIKTGIVGKDLGLNAMDQMWFSQTPILCSGQYEKERPFSSVTEVDMVQEGRLASWEEKNTENLGKLVCILEKIGEAVKKVLGRKCAIIHTEKSGILKVYKATNENSQGLPADILAKWNI